MSRIMDSPYLCWSRHSRAAAPKGRLPQCGKGCQEILDAVRQTVSTQENLRRPADVPFPLGETAFELAPQGFQGRQVRGLLGEEREVHQGLLAGQELGQLDEAAAVALPRPSEQLPAGRTAGIGGGRQRAF